MASSEYPFLENDQFHLLNTSVVSNCEGAQPVKMFGFNFNVSALDQIISNFLSLKFCLSVSGDGLSLN